MFSDLNLVAMPPASNTTGSNYHSTSTSTPNHRGFGSHFHDILVPAVLDRASPADKYETLSHGIYSYFESAYGTKSPCKHHQKKRPLHNTSLKEVARQKKLAKQALLQA